MRNSFAWPIALACGAALMALLLIYQTRQGQPATNPANTMLSSTRIVLNGKKIFPIGLYHVSWAGTPQQKHDALEKIGAAGFNLMHPALDSNDMDFVKRAAELGVNLIIEPNEPNGNGTRDVIEAFKDEPNVLGWLVADDFNSESHVKTPQTIQEQVDLVKSIAPNQHTYMSGNTRTLDAFVGLTDMIGIQTYSIPTEALSVTDQMLSYSLTHTAPNNVSLIANLQSWSATNRRAPRPDEVRNITYQALINGVDGILYYTYLDPTWNLEDHPKLWAELTRIASEVQVLTPAILNGTLRTIDSGLPEVRIGQWSYNEQRYVVIINMTSNPVTKFSLELPEVTQITPLFEDRPTPLTLVNGVIVGNLGPTSVYVYLVE